MNRVLYLLLVLLAASCSPIIYAPNTHHVPILKESGDVAIEGSYADTGFTQGGAVAVAVGVSEKDGVGGSFNILRGIESDTDERSALNFFDFYYIRHGLVGQNPKFVWAVTPGFGYAATRAEFFVSQETFKASYIKPFLLPSIGYTSRNFEAILSARFSYVNYVKSESEIRDYDELFKDNGNQFVFEPALTLRAGGQNVKVQTQLALSTFKFDGQELEEIFFYDNTIFTLGLQFYIPSAKDDVSSK